MPDEVNSQITDAVTQANVRVLAESPDVALSALYQAMAHSLGLAFENSVTAQQQLNVLAQAATALAVQALEVRAVLASSKIAQSDVPDNMLSLLGALKASTSQ